MNDCLKILSRVLSSIEFCILVVYFHDKLYREYPKVCVNLQTDVR